MKCTIVSGHSNPFSNARSQSACFRLQVNQIFLNCCCVLESHPGGSSNTPIVLFSSVSTVQLSTVSFCIASK